LIGNVLGNRYRILREIGSGGMAKVYLSEDIRENELVAVKVLYPQFSQDVAFVQRFNREARLASTLTDPHIVRVLDYGADRDLYYLVMEYLEGQTLHDVLKKKGHFDWKFALEVIDQLATALEHAHDHGVIHRDIKPQNLMLSETGLLKVLDFGIARIPTLPSLTQSGFIGSPYYASPEQAMGEEVDIRSDIYSSGVALYELLSGNVPFDAKSPWSIISKHITAEPAPIVLEDDEVPDNVHDLLYHMLAKRPENRFQTPTSLRRAIAEVLAGRPLPEDFQDTKSLDTSELTRMVESLRERATEAMETEEWPRAVDLLSQVAKLDPSDTDAARKLAKAEREARLISLYMAGCREAENNRWEEAINQFNVVIELDPGYKDAAEMLAKAHETLKSENSQQFVTTRYAEGLAHFEAQRWESAAKAFNEVQQVTPNYEQVEGLLAEATRKSNPSLIQWLIVSLKSQSQDLWRWSLVGTGAIIIIILSFMAFGSSTQVSGNDDPKEHLRLLYTEAQQALEQGNKEEAIAKLEEILSENPDYADAADIRRELVATPTPTATTASEPTVIVVTVIPKEEPLAATLDKAREAVDLALWSEALDLLGQLRIIDPNYQSARVSSLFCDTYLGRGLEVIDNLDPQDNEIEAMGQALADFEAGTTECPRRIDLKDRAERAATYLEALNTLENDYDSLIRILAQIVAAEPNYANNKAKNLLYEAYLNRAEANQASQETIALALGDYEAALELNVDDPSEAHLRRAELLLQFQRPVAQATAQPEATTISSSNGEATPSSTPSSEPSPTVEPVGMIYSKPQLIGPQDDAFFAGTLFEGVILEWEPTANLGEDEYYDLTIMHIFGEEPNYSGSRRTRETRVQLEGTSIGVGEAGNDRFYWWVTVRKDNSAPSSDRLDLPLSPQSDIATFIWTP